MAIIRQNPSVDQVHVALFLPIPDISNWLGNEE